MSTQLCRLVPLARIAFLWLLALWLAGIAPLAQAQNLRSLGFQPSGTGDGVTPYGTPGGIPIPCRVTLTGPAGMNGVMVTLTSSNPNLVTPPMTVLVMPGESRADFTVTPIAVSATASAILTASLNGINLTATLNVNPPQLPDTTGLQLSAPSITGGRYVTATITLDGPAPAGGWSITLSTSNPQAVALGTSLTPISLPASISVPATQRRYSFPLLTSTANHATPVTVIATDPTTGSAVSTILTLNPANLYVYNLVLPNRIQLRWDCVTSGAHFYLQRGSDPPVTLPSSATSYDDVFPAGFTNGQLTLYQLSDDSGVLASTQIAPYTLAATDNQAVDSRLDPRYATRVLLDHCFGTTSYRGGLFAGYASDPSQIGRSFAKFALPALAGNLTFGTGGVNAYFTGAKTTGGATVSLEVGCQAIPDTGWDGATMKWSTAPLFDPTRALQTLSITYDPNNPSPGWYSWPLGDAIYSALGQPFAVAWASRNENAPGWAYFAKKEFDPAKAPTVAYVLEQPRLLRFVIDADSLNAGGSQVLGQITVNGIGPSDSAVVAVQNGTVPEGTVTVTGLIRSFLINRASGIDTSSTFTATYQGVTITATIGQVIP